MKKYIKKRINDLLENVELSKLDDKHVKGQVHEIRELIEEYSSDEEATHFSQKINEIEEKIIQKKNCEPIYLFSRYKIINNDLRLSILENQALEYKDILFSERKSSEIKLNSDFFKNQQKERIEIETKTNEEKPIFISKRIDNLREISSKIKDNVIDFQNNKYLKDELFKYLEQEIEQFSAMIEQLQSENRQLKQELELLLEKSQKESQKSNLEKENSSLKEKIEAFQNKDKTPFDEDIKEKKPQKLNNKVTYTHEMEN